MTPLEDRVTKLEDLVSSLEHLVADLRQQIRGLESRVEATANVTDSVKRDTEEIVSIVKGFKFLGVLAKAGAAIAAFWVILRGGKLW